MSNARDKANIPALNFSSTGIDDNATSTAITIDSSQNVGIGTASPSTNLDISSSGDATINLKASGQANGLQLSQLTSDGGSSISATNNNYLKFLTNATERMRIDSSGKVGIGTSSPSSKLEVNGTITIGTGTGTYQAGVLGFTDTNFGFGYRPPRAGAIAAHSFHTFNGTRILEITESGNVGIGESIPLGKLHVKSADSGVTTPDAGADDLIIESSTDTGMSFLSTDTATIRFNDANGSGDASYQYRHDDRSTRIVSAGSERMRILSDGSVQINHDTREDVEMLGIRYSGNVANGIFVNSNTTNNSNAMLIANDANGVVGKIRSSGTSTSYITTSDYRLKENVNYGFDATTRLKQLKPARFNFIADADIIVDGFLAHEVQDIVPEAISGEKDETKTKEKVVVNANGKVIAENIEQADWEAGKIADEDGNTKYPTDSTWEATKVVPVYQGIDQSKLVPLLVKTIQELEARITALENA